MNDCECCQSDAWPDDPVESLREQNHVLRLAMMELVRALGAQRRENIRLEANRRQVAAELTAAYCRLSSNPDQAIEEAAATEVAAGPNGTDLTRKKEKESCHVCSHWKKSRPSKRN